MMLSLDTAYRSFGGEVEASSTPTICRLPDSCRHQLSAIAPRSASMSVTQSIECQQSSHVLVRFYRQDVKQHKLIAMVCSKLLTFKPIACSGSRAAFPATLAP